MMDKLQKLGIITVLLAFLVVFFTVGLLGESDLKQANEKEQLLRQLNQANKDALYYRTQYLKANTQLIEIKTKCIYCAD